MVWPARWGLPSIDARCLEAIIYLHLALPAHYSTVEPADPDQSPNAQLPFLTHGQIIVSPSLSSIHPYPTMVTPNFDAGLSALQLSQRTAWRGYFEAQLGDLVIHSLFVLGPNLSLTHAMLASMLPVSQPYYVPRRIKRIIDRALRGGMFEPGEIKMKPAKLKSSALSGRPKHATPCAADGYIHLVAKLVEKARLVLDILAKLLSEKSLLFIDRPTSAASLILLLTNAPLPNSALKDLLRASYPSLISHATRISTLAFPFSPSASNPRPQILPPKRKNPLMIFKSSLTHFSTSHAHESEAVTRFRRKFILQVLIPLYIKNQYKQTLKILPTNSQSDEPSPVPLYSPLKASILCLVSPVISITPVLNFSLAASLAILLGIPLSVSSPKLGLISKMAIAMLYYMLLFPIW
ncbi:hypothetical protein JB92DRAFT_2707619 [Gautieria morchelliformis]|nr:hypothetical protein JB92DRAFT_2707619 [Gautieria morchelliformis]